MRDLLVIVRSIDKKLYDNNLGRALKFYSTIRMSVRAGDRIKDGNDIVGRMVA